MFSSWDVEIPQEKQETQEWTFSWSNLTEKIKETVFYVKLGKTSG